MPTDAGARVPEAMHVETGELGWHVVLNVLLFVPLGLIVRNGGNQDHRGLGRVLIRAAGAGLCLSIAIECLQLFLPQREPSIVDLAANTFGTLMGACVSLRRAADVCERSSPP